MQSNINPLCPAGHIAPKVYRIRCIYRKSVRIYIAPCIAGQWWWVVPAVANLMLVRTKKAAVCSTSLFERGGPPYNTVAVLVYFQTCNYFLY